MGAVRTLSIQSQHFFLSGDAEHTCIRLASPTEADLAQIGGQQEGFAGTTDGSAQAHIELSNDANSCKLGFGGAVAYQAKFKTALSGLYSRLQKKPSLATTIEAARIRFDQLSSLAFELHHNASVHANISGRSATRLMLLNFDRESNALQLAVSDAGPGIVSHYKSSMIGKTATQGMNDAAILSTLLTTHSSSIPDRSLGGGLPKVLELSCKLGATLQIRTDGLCAMSNEAGNDEMTVEQYPAKIGTHWIVDVPCK